MKFQFKVQDYKTETVGSVLRDSSFANDSAMVNFEQVFNTYSPNTIRRVL